MRSSSRALFSSQSKKRIDVFREKHEGIVFVLWIVQT